jgi:hypothetical protein
MKNLLKSLRRKLTTCRRPLLLPCQLMLISYVSLGHAQVPYGMEPLPTVAGVPFLPNVFGAAASDAAAAKSSTPKPVPGMPRDVYVSHASVYMWADETGEARYSATLALHSVTFFMSKQKCMEQNGGDEKSCKLVYDAKTPALAVVKASDGGFFFTKGKNKADARKKGMAACAKRPNVTCTIDKVYSS